MTAALVTVVALPELVTSPVRLALVVTCPAVNPGAVPVILVPTRADGVPRAGVINVGLVSTTNLVPVPVLLAILVALPTEVITPVKLALVATVVAVPAVNPDAVPVAFVAIERLEFRG